MTEVVEGFKSEVTSDGGYYQRIQDREAHKEKMRLKKEEEKAQAAENTIRLQQAREESRKQAAMLAEAKRLAQIAAEKPAPAIMPVAVSALKAEPVPKAASAQKVSTSHLPPAQSPASQKTHKAEQVDAKKDTETRDVETLKTAQGAVHVPAELPPLATNAALKEEARPLVNVAQDLGAIMPAPAELTVGQEPEVPVAVESGKRLIERLLSAGTVSPATTADEEPELEIKSKRGVERIQKIMHEKRELENQVEEMQVTILSLQDVVRKYEIESRLVENVMNTTEGQKSKPELISQARTIMMEYLQSRNNEIDHAAKVECFNKYLADPFYMQIFVQNNKPEDWQSTIEFIYNEIEMTNIPIRPTRLSFLKGAQPIRARTATLGTPLMTADNPIERITQHLGNMGI